MRKRPAFGNTQNVVAHIKQTKFDIMKNSIKFALIFSGVILLLFFTDTIGFWGLIGLMFLMIVISAIWSANEGEKERK